MKEGEDYMKKLLSLVLALVLVLSLVGCGSDSGAEIQEPVDVAGDITDTVEDNEATEPVAEELPEENKSEDVAISETVLVDEKGVKITAKSLNMDGLFGPEIKILIENESGEDLTFQIRKASVNGYMVETMMSVDVVNGKKANDSIVFMDTDLKAAGIKTIADMEFSFHIFYTSDWEDYLNTEIIQLTTTAAETYEYTFDDSGKVAYEGNEMKIVIKGLAEDESLFGPSIVVYIENNSGKDITVQTRDVSINGFMVDAMFSSDVATGKHAIDTITFMDTDLEENEITEITDVELSFHIFDYSDWDTIVDTDTITMTF